MVKQCVYDAMTNFERLSVQLVHVEVNVLAVQGANSYPPGANGVVALSVIVAKIAFQCSGLKDTPWVLCQEAGPIRWREGRVVSTSKGPCRPPSYPPGTIQMCKFTFFPNWAFAVF